MGNAKGHRLSHLRCALASVCAFVLAASGYSAEYIDGQETISSDTTIIVQTTGTLPQVTGYGVEIQVTTTGLTRGAFAVDLQATRGATSEVASGDYSVIGGGEDNTASGEHSNVGGGSDNTASNFFSTASGGESNTASGYYATVPGGADNTASGDFSFAAGRRAKATASGSFALADDTNADFTNSTASTLFARFASGYAMTGGDFGIGTTAAASPLHVSAPSVCTVQIEDSGLNSGYISFNSSGVNNFFDVWTSSDVGDNSIIAINRATDTTGTAQLRLYPGNLSSVEFVSLSSDASGNFDIDPYGGTSAFAGYITVTSGITGEHLTSTDDATITDDLTVGGLATINGGLDPAGAGDVGDYTCIVGSGAGLNNSGDTVTAFGVDAGANNTFNEIILFGNGATATASNQCVVGSSFVGYTDFYLGTGVSQAGPSDIYIHGTDSTSTARGSTVTIAGGLSASGTAGHVVLRSGADVALTASGDDIAIADGLTVGGISVLPDINITGSIGYPVSDTFIDIDPTAITVYVDDWQVLLLDESSDYAAEFFKHGNSTSAKGVKIRCGENTPSGTVTAIGIFDGDDDLEGGLENAAGTIQIFNVSDRKLKENITTTTLNARQMISGLRVRDFNFKGRGERHTGFIAQELEEVYPEAVGEKTYVDGSGTSVTVKVIRPLMLIPLLVDAQKQQQRQIDRMKQDIKDLKAAVAALQP